MKTAFYDASGWHYETVDPTGGNGVSLALDAAGYPRMSYGTNAGQLTYAYRNSSGWHIESVAAGSFSQTSLAVDGSGYAHISAYDAANADLVYARQDAAGWHSEVVDNNGSVGLSNSLAVTAAGQAMISYYDAGNRDLKLAVRQSGPPPTATPLPLPKIGYAAYANTAPIIDGNLADWPALQGVLLDRWQAVDYGGVVTSAADLSATCYSQWSTTHLYVGCLVSDDALVADSGTEWWKDDTIEVVYDGRNDNQSYGPDDHKYEMRIDGGFSDYTNPVNPNVIAAYRPRTGGYSVELAIPLAELGVPAFQANQVIGFNIGLIDDDNGGEAEGWLGWSGNTFRHAEFAGT